jgi:hypothetical protein
MAKDPLSIQSVFLPALGGMDESVSETDMHDNQAGALTFIPLNTARGVFPFFQGMHQRMPIIQHKKSWVFINLLMESVSMVTTCKPMPSFTIIFAPHHLTCGFTFTSNVFQNFTGSTT